MSRTLILVNPKAREGNRKTNWENRKKQIVHALGGGPVEIAFTSEQDYGSGLVKKALLSGATKIVVVGGDGTLSEAIQGFFEGGRSIAPEAVLMVMPGGRGDDFFKTLTNRRFIRGRSAWSKGLELIQSGAPILVDVGRLSWIGAQVTPPSRYFLNITSFGYPGLVVDRVQTRRGLLGGSILGKSAWTYSYQGVAALSDYRPLKVEVKVDNQTFFNGKIQSGFVLNGRFNAGGICWDADARLDDGLFNVLVMEHNTIFSYLRNTSNILLGRRKELPGVFQTQGKKVEVLFTGIQKKPHPFFEVDGDLFEDDGTLGAVFETIPSVIRIQTIN